MGSILSAQPGRWTPGPGLSSDPHWRPPVANVAALPATGNTPGDARVTLDSFATWIWDGNSWEMPPASSSAPSGPASGDLAGTYPGPTIALDAVALGTDTTGGYAASASEGGPATAALALASNPANCVSGIPRGGDAAGAAEGCADVVLGTDTSGGYAGSSTEGGPATSALSLAGDVALGTGTSGGYAGSSTEAGTATTSLAFAADPADCNPATHVAVGIAADGTAVCEPKAAGVTAHGDLTGLDLDQHPGAPWLAGRSGGQTLSGGTVAGETLTLRGTAHATPGPIVTVGPIRYSGSYSASAPCYSYAAETDTGLCRSAVGEQRFSFGGTNSIRLVYNRIDIERSDGAVCFGDPDVCIKKSGTNEATITNASSGYGRLRFDASRLVPRASAPFSCSAATEGWEYANSVSHEKCFCTGTAWVGLVAGGAC